MKKRNWLLLAAGLLAGCCVFGVVLQTFFPSAPRPTHDAPTPTAPLPAAATSLPDSGAPAASPTSAAVLPTRTARPSATTPPTLTARPTRTPPPTIDPTVAALGYVCAGEPCIKGNIGDKRLYHLPGCPSYDATKAEQMFASEADARAAGFERAGNCR